MIIDAFGKGELLKNLDTFTSFYSFFNELIQSTVHETMVENLVNRFFNEFLLGKIQPVLLNSEDSIEKRTCLQYIVHMLDLSSSNKICEITYYFLFGFPDGHSLKAAINNNKEEEVKENSNIDKINNNDFDYENIGEVDEIVNDNEFFVMDEDQAQML